MALIETLTISVGAAVAKTIMKVWLKDFEIGNEATSNIIDYFKNKTADLIARRNGQRQFDQIAERVAETILPLFEVEGDNIPDNGKNAVALAVSGSLNRTRIDASMLAQKNLDPVAVVAAVELQNPEATRDLGARESALYKRILSETSQSIVDIASQLPSFSERTFAEILKRDTQILEVASKVLADVKRIREISERTNTDADATLFEANYRKAVVRNLDEIELFGVDLSSTSQRHSLSVAYITLSIQKSLLNGSPQDDVHLQESEKESNSNHSEHSELVAGDTASNIADEVPVAADVALARSKRILVRGDAGSGKTTLLQYIAVRAASKGFVGVLEDWNQCIPFFVRLRQCGGETLPPPEKLPGLIAPTIAATMPPLWVHEKLRFGRAILLVDGLDEVTKLSRQTVKKWLKELLSFNPDIRVVITSRRTAIEPGFMSEEGFYDTELLPMQMSDISAFIEHWHSAVARSVEALEDRKELETLAKDLDLTIRGTPAIRNLASTPVLCAMLCGLHRDRRRQLPSDRIELYRICCEALVDRRDQERGVVLSDYPTMSYPQKVAILQDIAYWLLLNNWSMAAMEKGEARVASKIQNMHSMPADASPGKVLRYLVDRTGVIREPIEGNLDFTHRTFQEYLAAKAILGEGSVGLLIDRAHDDQWREVFILAAGLADSRDREELIQGALDRGDKEGRRRQQLHLLAVACMEASLELDSGMVSKIKERFATLVPPKNLTEAKALASAGELAVPYLARPSEGMYATEAAACVRTLALIGTDSALEALSHYRNEQRQTIWVQLVRARESFDKALFAKRIFGDRAVITIDDCNSLEGFECLKSLRSLVMWRSSVTDLEPLSRLTDLSYLFISGNPKIKSLTPLANLTALHDLALWGGFGEAKFTWLRRLSRLARLQLAPCGELRDFSDLGLLSELGTLRISGCNNCESFEFLKNLRSLHTLELYRFGQVTPIDYLDGMDKMTTLTIQGLRSGFDCSQIGSLPRLKKLSFEDCGAIFNITQLSDFEGLSSLSLKGCDGVIDINELSALKDLRALHLGGCKLENLGSLSNLQSLRWIALEPALFSLLPSEVKNRLKVARPVTSRLP